MKITRSFIHESKKVEGANSIGGETGAIHIIIHNYTIIML